MDVTVKDFLVVANLLTLNLPSFAQMYGKMCLEIWLYQTAGMAIRSFMPCQYWPWLVNPYSDAIQRTNKDQLTRLM